MSVLCVQYLYCNEYGLAAKVTALVSKDLGQVEAKKQIVKEILGNYTVDNNINYTSKLENVAIENTQDIVIGLLQFDVDYPYADSFQDFIILDFHKMNNWLVN